MNKKAKILLISVLGILMILLLTALIFLVSVRGEFVKHLDEKYPDLSFTVGIAKIDPIYDSFYAEVTCLDDYTPFLISRGFKSQDIYEDYLECKSQNGYNSKINNVFYMSEIESKIKSVTGLGKEFFTNDAIYTQINIYLVDNAEHISVAKKAMNLLDEHNISAETIILTYEKDNHVYEIWLSSDDYSLTENEIEEKVKKIK
ncbi:hypothetical protein SAMN00017405_1052 [Desulfonispora thiosulfatigenes DSM 11270]|uniref:Uncharacterized protein n=1 Tax=Desulfonispora thiosulfatigenes DSM 11270 TaxID=656914 RepID=A0A1W1UQZ1_DESTI|nr:hypothetical protein [Desulfonispora thiosulfatigenes]SMB83522.1 hypothetical protein SAMN00017405_1052 [Desulfonispora thiosulfatigenes DSM 11270]